MADSSNAVQVIGAIGAVVSSLVALYLVHRRILADRETRIHRADECEVQEALIKKLRLQVARLEKTKTPKA